VRRAREIPIHGNLVRRETTASQRLHAAAKAQFDPLDKHQIHEPLDLTRKPSPLSFRHLVCHLAPDFENTTAARRAPHARAVRSAVRPAMTPNALSFSLG
jgi:hypothetical protein